MSSSADALRHALVAAIALGVAVAGPHLHAQEQPAAPEQTAPREQTGTPEQTEEPAQTEAAEPPAAAKHTPAVLKLRTFSFPYRSSVVRYTCHELEVRVSVILRALGARDDVQVSTTGCNTVEMPTDESLESGSRSDPWRTSTDPWRTSPSHMYEDDVHEQYANVRVRAMLPTEVTPEVLAEMDKDKSRRELISRVQGAASNLLDPIVFPAERKLVELSHRTIRLGPEDCELVEQMSKSTFRKLDLRVVSKSMSCDRRGVSRFAPQLVVDALMPVMP